MEAETRTPRKQNPRERINPLSALLFIHMFPIFRRNYKKGLKEDDLFEPLPEHKSSTLGDMLEDKWRQEHRNHKKWALHRALFRQFGFELGIIGILKLINEMVLIVVMPIAIGGLVSYFESGDSKIAKEEAYMYAGLIIASLVIDGFISHPTMMAMMHMCMKMRVSCCSLIYRKSLRLSRTALAETTIGQIVNLLSNDVSKFDQGFVLCHYVWIAPIQTIVGTYLLYRVIGVSAFSGIGFLLLFIPLQIYLGQRTSVLRLRTAIRTDERVRLMNEILNGIQVIKMYTWEKPFAKLVGFARRYEIKSIRAHFFLEAIMFSLEMFITRTSIFISLIVYISLGNDITADTAYSVTAIYNVLRPIMTMLFSISIASLAEVHISVCRLQNFLSHEELPQLQYDSVKHDKVQENCVILKNEKEKLIAVKEPKISLRNVSAKWLKETSDNTLTDINLVIDRSQLVALIGPVGSGKSSLFNVILKELPICSGIMQIDGKISYTSQEAWLFSASVRQNILFGDAYEEDRYKAVVKICALESDLAMLPYGDRTIVGEKGKALSGGQKTRINLARCIYKRADIYLLDDPLSAVDTKVGKQLYDECIKKFLYDKICILITHQLQYLQNADKILILKEGKIIGEGNYNELQTTGLDFAKLLQEFHSGEDLEEGDKKKIKSRQNSEMPEEDYEDDEENPDIAKETAASGHIKAATYAAYFKAGGNYFIMFLLFLAFISSQVAGNGGDYYLSYWVNLEQEANDINQNNTTGEEVEVDRDTITYVYSGITAATIILALGHSVFYFVFFMRASVNMHAYIFESISHATMRFFNANPTGRILNRFSKDMGIIDEYIPFVMSDVFEIALLLSGTIILTSIVNPWLALPSVALLVLFYLLRIIYLETSRSVKRIEGITRSPIFSHMTASMHGLPTIRAFSAQKTLTREFDDHQDLHSSAWYLFISASRAFGFWLDMICITFISLVILSLLVLNREYYGGEVGLIVTQYLSLTGVLQWGMRQWSELENHMTSVERVLEYTKVETEPIRKQISLLPKKWPEFGKIVFQGVSMKYNPDEAPVLRDLDFTIYPREKVGIVGRTGAGKTSTIAALFQLYDIEGSIVIDDVDTTQLPLDELRSKISIIPQDPVLFSGTMRKNLDPFEEYSDDNLWNALEQVELKDVIAEAAAGLNTNVSESGSNFSIGQRQLVCLARAIIRNNKILVMDEATANVDPHTDSLIQKTIRRKFADCTVITIAHRLHTIMDSDRVLVIDAGKVVEFDHPHNLLQRTDSIFYTMVNTTGKTASKNLQTIAEELHEAKEHINKMDSSPQVEKIGI